MSRAEQPDAAPAPLSRGHKKRERTRRGLIDAAVRLFARKEVGEIALLDVASEAEVASGTIYNYFRTALRLAIGVRMFIRHAMADPDWASAVIRVVHFDRAMRSKIANYVLADLRAGAEEGALTYSDECIALDLVVSCTLGAMRSVVEGRSASGHDTQVAEMVLKAPGASAA